MIENRRLIYFYICLPTAGFKSHATWLGSEKETFTCYAACYFDRNALHVGFDVSSPLAIVSNGYVFET